MIEAGFDSRCPGCGEWIPEGTTIGLVDDEWCCDHCVTDMGEDGWEETADAGR